MKEFNNRKIADKFAEYITGDELRRYVARKVHQYVGNNPSVFDGACGSGQLEQYINASFIQGIEIQKEACDVFLENYPTSKVINDSFFNQSGFTDFDCIIMNPPFSIKFKDLSETEQSNIQSEFEWKKSGVVDDIFVLKSMQYTKDYGFFILFPGVTYRSQEQKFRDLLGNSLVELNSVENAFEDTSITIVFLVLQKSKKYVDVKKEIYDCKTKQVKFSEIITNLEDVWSVPRVPQEKESIDIEQLEADIARMKAHRRRIEDKLDKFIYETFKVPSTQEISDKENEQLTLF